jgi:transcriptional regulator with XRE-family HTH domain
MLNAKEIQFLRKNMGMKATELKLLLGVSSEAISRWENGDRKISAANDRLLRIIYSHQKGIAPDKIAHLVTEGIKCIARSERATPLYQIDLKEDFTPTFLPACAV